MSLVYSDTSTYKGIIQEIERNIYGMDAVGRISGNTVLLKQWTAKVNLALDRVTSLILKADGNWQYDDSNHTTYPTVTTALVSGQRNYDFVQDSAGNLLLDIRRVYVLNNGFYQEIEPVDEMSEAGMYSGQDLTGKPYRYGKKSSGIFLEPIPDSNVSAGLKVEVSREGSYFVYTDTTKKPGFSGIFHEYLAVKPSAEYAKLHGLENAVALEAKRLEMEADIKSHYDKRSKDEQSVMSGVSINAE